MSAESVPVDRIGFQKPVFNGVDQEVNTMDQQIEKIPFIRFLYADAEGVRKIYDADWPDQFIAYFTGKEVTEIGGFFLMGFPQPVRTLEDAFKICRG